MLFLLAVICPRNSRCRCQARFNAKARGGLLIEVEEKINRIATMEAPRPVRAGRVLRVLVGVGDRASSIGCEFE
jgi:hypothetical protein